MQEFKNKIAKLPEPELRGIFDKIKIKMSDMEFQLAEQNILLKAGAELNDEALDWRSSCLAALKWERRRFFIIRRVLSAVQKEDDMLFHLKNSCRLLKKFLGKECKTPTEEDRKQFYSTLGYLRGVDASSEF